MVLNDLLIQGERFLLVDILLNVAIAFVLGAATALVYRRTHRGFNYSPSFVNTIVILPMITAIVMMVIGNNLARAFGLVGAMSIIRFRTVVKDTRDTAFIFLSLAGGMACGAGYHLIALAGSASVLALVGVLYALSFGSVRRSDQLVRFSVTPDERGSMVHESVFREHLKRNTLLDIQTRNEGRTLELSYYVHLRAPERFQDFVRDLGALDGVDDVSLIAMEETAEA